MSEPRSTEATHDVPLRQLGGASSPMAIQVAMHRAVLDNLDEGAYMVDLARRVVYWNPAAERITGFDAKDVVGNCCRDNILNHTDETGTCLCTHACPLSHAMKVGEIREAHPFFHHKQGHRVPTVVRAVPVFGMDGEVVGAIELFTDARSVHMLHERVAELEDLAYLDPLTRLPNRRYVMDALTRRLNESSRTHKPFGVAMLDIDHFKRFNDTYGHATGDEVIKLVGRSATENIRSTDIVGRWGGEEFLGVFPNILASDLERLLERMRSLIGASWLNQGGEQVCVTVSIGATISREDDTIATIVDRADARLYDSKEGGRNRVTMDRPEAAAA